MYDKELITEAVKYGTREDLEDVFELHKLVLDDSFFDYDILKLALKRDDEEIANYLILKQCSRVTRPNKDDDDDDLWEKTPLYLATKYNRIGCIQTILEGGDSIYKKNHFGRLPIYEAFTQGHLDVCKEILNYCCSLKNLNPKNEDDVIHFHFACVLNVENAVKAYLEFDFDVNSTLSLDVGDDDEVSSISQQIVQIQSGKTPLHFASEFAFPKIVELLLEYGADVDKTDEEGRTPLLMAISMYTSLVGEYPEMDTERELSRKVTEILLEKKRRLYLADISFLNEWEDSLNDIFFIEYAQLYQVIYIHVQKLLTLQLHVCENVPEFCDKLKPLYERALSMTDTLTDLDTIQEDCRKELEKIKLEIIDDDGTSLYNTLFKDSQEVSKYITSANDYYKILCEDKTEEFLPFYGYLLKMQYKKGIRHPLKYSKPFLEESLCHSCFGGVNKGRELTDSNVSEDNVH